MEKRRIPSYRHERVALIVCIVLNVCATVTGYSQGSPFDDEALREAREHFDYDRIDEAQAGYLSIIDEHCTTGGDAEICFEAKVGLRKICIRNGDEETVKLIAGELGEIVSKHLDDELFYHAKLAKTRLIESSESNELVKADEWANRLHEIIDAAGGDQYTLAVAHNAIGYYEDTLGNYENAIYHYNTAIELARNVNLFEKTGRLLMQAHNNLGVSYKNMGMIEEAKKEYELSLDIIRRLFGEKNRNEGWTLINIGNIHYLKGDIGLAAEYFQRSFEIYKSLTGNYSSDLGASLNNLAASHFRLGNYDKAASFFEEAQRLKEENLGFDHPETAIGYSNLAAIHILNSDFEAARENIERSITVREAIYGSDHPSLIEPIIMLGNLYDVHLAQYKEARIHYQSALDIANQRLGESHPDVTDIYIQIGKSYMAEDNYLSAELFIDSAIKNLYGNYDLDQEIDLERTIASPITLLRTLYYKAELLKERNDEISVRDYQQSLMALEWASDLVDFVQQSFKNEASKLQLIESNYSIYTDAIETLAALYYETGNNSYKDRIFKTIEKSRSRVTLELIQKINARNYSGVPEDIIEKESNLNNQITRLQQQLYQEENAGPEENSLRFTALRDSIFKYKRGLEDFTVELEKEYPAYYSLKYDQSVINRQRAQSLLNDDEVVLSYVLGTNFAYVLVISKDDINLVELGNTSDIDSQVLELKEMVLNNNSEAYKQTAHDLYKRLIQPVEQYTTGKQLLVMADQELHYLPFELLLKEIPDHHQFHRFPYLVHDYTISYIPSLTLLSEMNTGVVENPRNLLAIAPFNDEISVEDRSLMDHQYSSSANPLYLTQYETATITSQFQSRRTLTEYFRPQQTELLLGIDATFSGFSKSSHNEYDYIHFATHAFINEERPEYSAILLYPEEENPGIAYVGDIYNMELNADLVVLGACQTGMGSIYKGEGLIGFTRAFIYAGASNLAVSMWRVSDQPTAYLMIDFYDLIRQGFGYNEALRQAKLNLISKPQFANPVNWAAFTLTGR